MAQRRFQAAAGVCLMYSRLFVDHPKGAFLNALFTDLTLRFAEEKHVTTSHCAVPS